MWNIGLSLISAKQPVLVSENTKVSDGCIICYLNSQVRHRFYYSLAVSASYDHPKYEFVPLRDVYTAENFEFLTKFGKSGKMQCLIRYHG